MAGVYYWVGVFCGRAVGVDEYNRVEVATAEHHYFVGLCCGVGVDRAVGAL